MGKFRNELQNVTLLLKRHAILIFAICIIILFNLFLIHGNYISPENSSSPSTNTVNIVKTKSEKVKFSASKVYSLVLKLTNNTSAVNGEYTLIRLFSKNKVIYEKKVLNNSSLPQDGPNGIGTQFILNGNKGLHVKKNRNYRLVLSTNATEGKEISAFSNKGKIWINPTYNWISEKSLKIFLISIEILLVLVVYAILKLKLLKKFFNKVENQFMFASVVLILLYSFVIPLLRVPDEFSHFVRVYGILHGSFLVPKSGNLLVPSNLIPVIDPTQSTIYEVFRNFNISLNSHFIKSNAINMALYSPQSYILQLFGVGSISLITKNPFIMIYGGRIITGLGCTLILYFAIKYIPFGKRILAICSLIPMNLSERASLSADGFTFVLVIAIFAFSMYLTYSKAKMTTKKLLLMYLLLFFLASCKVIYFIFGFLILIIPNKKFRNFQVAILHKSLGSVILLVTTISWLKIASRYLVNTQGGSNSGEKIQFIIHQPITYIEIMNQTFWSNIHNYAEQLLTGPLGALNIPINYGLFLFMLFILFKTYYVEKSNMMTQDHSLSIQCFTSLLCIANILLIFTSLFIQWTNVTNLSNSISIIGIQGRYFLPVLPLIMIMFLLPNKAGIYEKESRFDDNLVFIIFLTNILVLSNAFLSCSL